MTLKEQIIALRAQGLTQQQVATKLNISLSKVKRNLKIPTNVFSNDEGLTGDDLKRYLKAHGWTYAGHWHQSIEYYHNNVHDVNIDMPVKHLVKYRDKMHKALITVAKIENKHIKQLQEDIAEFSRQNPIKVEVAKDSPDTSKEKLLHILDHQEMLHKRYESEMYGIDADKSAKNERESNGRFGKGNTIGAFLHNGVSSTEIRRHRAYLNAHLPVLLPILKEKTLTDTSVAMWWTNKVLPDAKSATHTDSTPLNNVKTLTELKEQAAGVITDTLRGYATLEEVTQLMGVFQGHKTLIEAADIEPIAMELKKSMGK